MNKQRIEKVAVIGAGLMGHGIALEIAAAGYHVNLYDINEEILDTARKNIDYGLKKLVDSGKIKDDQVPKSKLLISKENRSFCQLKIRRVISVVVHFIILSPMKYCRFTNCC